MVSHAITSTYNQHLVVINLRKSLKIRLRIFPFGECVLLSMKSPTVLISKDRFLQI